MFDPNPISLSGDVIQKVVFSQDSSLLAFYDSGKCVGYLQAQPENLEAPWTYIGRYKSHTQPVVDVMFAPASDQGNRLFSVGKVSSVSKK